MYWNRFKSSVDIIAFCYHDGCLGIFLDNNYLNYVNLLTSIFLFVSKWEELTSFLAFFHLTFRIFFISIDSIKANKMEFL